MIRWNLSRRKCFVSLRTRPHTYVAGWRNESLASQTLVACKSNLDYSRKTVQLFYCLVSDGLQICFFLLFEFMCLHVYIWPLIKLWVVCMYSYCRMDCTEMTLDFLRLQNLCAKMVEFMNSRIRSIRGKSDGLVMPSN